MQTSGLLHQAKQKLKRGLRKKQGSNGWGPGEANGEGVTMVSGWWVARGLKSSVREEIGKKTLKFSLKCLDRKILRPTPG